MCSNRKTKIAFINCDEQNLQNQKLFSLMYWLIAIHLFKIVLVAIHLETIHLCITSHTIIVVLIFIYKLMFF